MAEIVISIAAKVAELLVVPIGKHICYPFKYESNMVDLKEQVEKLINARDRVQHSVDMAKRQGDEIEKDVEKWLNSVDAFAAQLVVKSIIDGEEDRAEKKLCSIGFCPNLISHYSLSKKAAKIAKAGIDLLAEGQFKDVSHRLAIRRTKSVYTRGYEDFGSRILVFEEIMKALADEDVNLIGVYGMGGVGKTTLVKRVAAQVLEDKLFDMVVMAEVTQTLDIKNIQEQIADELGLEFHEKSLSGRANRLRDRLKKEANVLVILDNIWEKLNLDDVGFPSLDDERASVTQEVVDERGRNAYKRQCKLLLTCRDFDVLRNDMNTQRNFYVDVLSDIEAMNLFWKIAGHSNEKQEFDRIAVEIVRKCAGLPIAITTIANALKNKDVSVWKNVLQWTRRSNPKPIKGMEASVYSTIELSYNILGFEEQSFFLLCCLCNSGRDLFTSDLFKYSMGLGLFKAVDTMEEARNRMHALIGNLKASCLLLDGNAKDFIKMHDIIQAVAVSIASSKDKLMFNIQNVISIKETLEEKLPKDSIAVSLPHRDIDELPERLEFPKLELLLLSNDKLSLQIPDAFLDGVKELKVLDLTRFHLLSLPRSLCRLTNLQTLCLDQCLIGDITIIGELKKLEILSFLNSEIEQLPREIRQLTRLRLLDLSNCSKLKVITPNVLSSLSRLEELYMGNSFVHWDVKGQRNASLAELKQLSYLTTLEIHVLDAQIMPHDLFFWKLERYKILIGDVWNWYGKYETSRTLKLKLNNNFFLSDGIKFLLNRAEDLYLDELKGGKNVLHELIGEGFQQLKHLHIQNASQIQYIINSDGWGLCSIFPQRLESLVLRNLINLENIYHGQLTVESFSHLKVIKVGKCDKLKYLTLPIAGNLSQLQEIEVTDCRKLEQIVLMESRQVHRNEQINMIEFTQLRTLTLQCLPRLTRFGFNALTPNMRLQEILAEDDPDSFIPFFFENVLLPRLENLKLCSINIECRWLDQLQAVSCCQTLVKLTVEECNSLNFLFSYSMVKSLVQLRELKIRNCGSMERIINTEESAEEERIVNMIFPELILLLLEGLQKLTRFGFGNSIEFPSLDSLWILDCPRLKIFFSGSTCANITVIEEQEATNSCADIYPLLDKKVLLPSLRHLKLNSIGSQVIWHSQLTAESFSQLKVIIVGKCDKLKYLTLPMARNLSQLQEIEVNHCRKLEQIVLKEGRQVHKNEQISKIEFTQLHTLTLQWLPRLTRFGFNVLTPDMRLQEILAEDDPDSFIPFFSQNVELPRLENLKLCSINIECRWLDQLPAVSSSCQTLAKLIVEECNGLNFLFSYSMVKSLVQLREIVIRNCKSMERIINIEESAAEERIIYMIFPKLNLLLLEGLPRLTGFGSGNSIEFPSLYTLGILDCPRLKMFFSGSTCANITASKEQEATNSSADIYPLLDKRVSLPSLRVLKLNSIRSQVIWHSQLLATSSSLNNLTILRIIGLGDLKYLFSSSMANSVVQLNILEIIDCKLMEAVIVEEEKGSSVLLFPNLEDLTLRNLPKLARFCYFNRNLIDRCSSLEQNMTASEECSGMDSKENLQANIQPLFDEKVGLLNIKILSIEKMDNLRKIWHDQLYSDSFSKLEQVHVCGCNNLLNVFPSNMFGRLRRMKILKVHKGDSVEEIFELEALGSKKTHDIAAAQLRTLEIHYLPKLKHVWNVDSQVILSYQNLHSISVQCCDSLKSLFPASVARGLVQLEELTINNCMMEEITAKDDTVEVEAVLRFFFPQLIELKLWNLSRLKSFYQGSYISEWPVLKKLEVWDCYEVEILASQVLSHGESRHEIPTGQPLFLVEKDAFPSLECLSVNWNCIKRQMLHGKFPEYLCKLNDLELAGPFKETAICPSCFLHKLPNLETLRVLHGFLKELLLCEGLGCKEKHAKLPGKLSYLNLCRLSDLHLWEESSELGNFFQNLRRLRLFRCGNLTSLIPSSMTFENLTTLEVDKCGGLLNLMAPSIAKSLLQLKRMDITDCEMMKEIITHKEDEAVNQIIFNQLEYLGLNCLPSLTVFYLGSWIIEFPSLQRVVVKQCPNMKLFSRGVISTPRLHTLQIAETEDVGCWEGDLNTTIEHRYIEKNAENSEQN